MPTENIEPSDQSLETANANDWLDLLIILAKHKRMIALITVGAGCLSVIISLLLPVIYTGTAKILPPQQTQSSAAMVIGQLSGLAGLPGGSLGLKNPNELYVGMVNSRTVADNVITRFDLQRLYNEDSMVLTRKTLANNTHVVTGKDGLITIEVEDEDATRAAAMANAYVEELRKLTQSLAVTEASQRRLFFEQQLRQAKEELSEAEVAMKAMQERTGLIQLDDQGRAIIEAVATLRAQIAAKEVERWALRTYATDENADYIRVGQQLAGLRAELAKLEGAQISGGGNILLPTGKVPEAGLEYVRRLRDVKYQETIFELLARQFEIAKIDEAKEAAIIQVVDAAVPRDRRTKPKRTLFVIAVTFVAGFIAVVTAFFREFWDSTRSDASKVARLSTLRRYLRVK